VQGGDTCVCVSAHNRVRSCAHASIEKQKYTNVVCMYMYARVSVCLCVYYRDKREPLENIQSLIEIGSEEHLRQKEKENCEE
jgi:hypothetical protein